MYISSKITFEFVEFNAACLFDFTLCQGYKHNKKLSNHSLAIALFESKTAISDFRYHVQFEGAGLYA